MRWQHWLAERFTDWLASPAALIQGLALTLPWLVLVGLGVDPHGFWFLFFATILSFLTQFPLAYAARRAERHMLNTMRLLLAVAERLEQGQDAQDAQLEDIEERLEGLS